MKEEESSFFLKNPIPINKATITCFNKIQVIKVTKGGKILRIPGIAKTSTELFRFLFHINKISMK